MKRGLCIGVTALAVALLAGSLLPGDDKKPDEPPKVKGQLPPHFKKLGLTDQQIQEIYKIQTSYRDKIQGLQQQLDDLKRAEHLDVDNVLTDEQKAHLKEILTSEVPTKDKPVQTDKDKPTPPPPDKDKTTPAPEKDKTPPPPDKDKDKLILIDKDKGPPAKDKDKDK